MNHDILCFQESKEVLGKGRGLIAGPGANLKKQPVTKCQAHGRQGKTEKLLESGD